MTALYIPQDAPFSTDQRVWLSGFLAGVQSRLLVAADAAGSGATSSAPVVHVLYGSQTGNAESVAEDAAEAARAQGLSPVVSALDDMDLDRLTTVERLLVVTSTYGEGEMPDNAELFWEALSAEGTPRLEQCEFAVLALGDTGYDGFCQAGKVIDTRLEQLGARRLTARVDCDVDYEDAAAAWVAETVPLLAAEAGAGAGAGAGADATLPEVAAKPKRKRSQWTRKNPYASTVAVNRCLSKPGSAKEIRHYEFALAESGLEYEAGDALGVMPINDPVLVQAVIDRLGIDGDTSVAGHDRPLRDVLAYSLEIRTPSHELITEIEQRAGDDELSHVVRHGDKEALDAWLWGKDVLDLLLLDPSPAFEVDEFTGLLRPLQHRAYSISSSPKAVPGSVHLTVASVRHCTDGRDRGGVCSTFLADRIGDGECAGIFVSPNKSFRVPTDDGAPMIMVGPGTGVAPFRAFLQERRARGASGKNWLFFGDQHRASDYIYEDELTQFADEGVLHRLDLAFSRDQADKVYVQTRMAEHGKELFGWLEEGGHFYVCGDASRMAKDVDRALHAVIETHGGMSADAASEYVNTLKREKRYLRDVY
ncbi:sulfite reductase subunit alpha [Rhodococcus triatomae]|uniref:assimilatory sulfite reductase (NADPH) n=1 Tax=Rhodococcus triatomae TaxID=300028 RepID=A0A1G8M4F9_9NOCA|nr:sulfite reductase subunit alpha [Rhodococcus triatomae]QNG18198.1 sulfite reductase subunit alpha [Rhodococcus triatomae]QNG22131.1 sulfite reductase subunit alpha [Rhodococcus triatomae]SDI62828.1 sulfite reductase (NADPH) flavoprotein alpha-component [Rhodococcus triatomae]